MGNLNSTITGALQSVVAENRALKSLQVIAGQAIPMVASVIGEWSETSPSNSTGVASINGTINVDFEDENGNTPSDPPLFSLANSCYCTTDGIWLSDFTGVGNVGVTGKRAVAKPYDSTWSSSSGRLTIYYWLVYDKNWGGRSASRDTTFKIKMSIVSTATVKNVSVTWSVS